MVHKVEVDLGPSPKKRGRLAPAAVHPFTSGACDPPGGLVQTFGVSPPGSDRPVPLRAGDFQNPESKVPPLNMYDTYQPWVLQTYGDQAKTKTITRNKYQRILQILRGDYIDNESSKFKLWVKGRGFRIGPPPGYFHQHNIIEQGLAPVGHPAIDYNPDKDPSPDIYVQTGTIKDSEGNDRICFKKVAIVEDFFEIIYNLHVCRDGKEQKHMGQKRTYRAVSERYAFVPREAVTKFLVLCTECPRRSVGVPVSLANIKSNINNNNSNNLNNNANAIVTPTKATTSTATLTTNLGTFTSSLNHPMILSPQHLGVTLPSSATTLNGVVRTTPTKAKSNFSVVSLVGKTTENEDSQNTPSVVSSLPQQHPATIQINRQGAFISSNGSLHQIPLSMADSLSLGHFYGSKVEVKEDPRVLQTAILPPTPPPSSTPCSPPKVLKLEPPQTPSTPMETNQMKPIVPPILSFDVPVVKKEKQEPVEEYESRVVKWEAEEEEESVDYSEKISELSTEVDFNLPITTLYLKHFKGVKRKRDVASTFSYEENNNICKEGNMADSDGSEDELKSGPPEKRFEQRPVEWSPYSQQQTASSQGGSEQQQKPLSLSKNDSSRRSPCLSPAGGASERPSGGTPQQSGQAESGNTEETSSNGNKDDDDDECEDDNEDEKIDAQYDPERLKAFNMFVRLFVDENLDRIVPISKQPKEKIQAIIDACARQFPEFADRTRKRIRTYLKSCRRNKRTRDSNGWENSRPTPPHLTSIQAEQILATACENEAQNAKRMRLGLEPISQPNPLAPQPVVSQSQHGSDKPLTIVDPSSMNKIEGSTATAITSSHNNSSSKTHERAPVESKVVNGSTVFQTNFPLGFQKVSNLSSSTAVHPQQLSALLPSSGAAPNNCSVTLTNSSTTSTAPVQLMANGPTDLSLKGASKTSPRPTLNAVEVAAVRQLITGYRESAGFLLRSADELENLLVHQQHP